MLFVLAARRVFLDEASSTSSIADDCRFLLADAPKENLFEAEEVAEPNDRRLATSPATCIPVLTGVSAAFVGEGDGAKTLRFLGVGSRLRPAEEIVG